MIQTLKKPKGVEVGGGVRYVHMYQHSKHINLNK